MARHSKLALPLCPELVPAIVPRVSALSTCHRNGEAVGLFQNARPVAVSRDLRFKARRRHSYATRTVAGIG
jgi:hypothetical protein